MALYSIACGNEYLYSNNESEALQAKYIQEAFNNYEVVMEEIDSNKKNKEVQKLINKYKNKWVIAQKIELQSGLKATIHLDVHGYPLESLKQYDAVRDIYAGKSTSIGSGDKDFDYILYKGSKKKTQRNCRGTGIVYINYTDAENMIMYFCLENNDENNAFTKKELLKRAKECRKIIIKQKIKLEEDLDKEFEIETDEDYTYNNLIYDESLYKIDEDSSYEELSDVAINENS